MNAQTLYQEGRLDDAIQALAGSLRDDPGNVRQRTFLFELLCFAGELDRAEKHLDVISGASRDAEMGALLYHSALHAERTRQAMFLAGDTPPAVNGAPPRRTVSGTLNGRPFQSLADVDPRIGARLEVFAAGQYTWLPLEHLAALTVEEPKHLRDLLWLPARVTAGPRFRGTDFGEVLLPVLYPLSWKSGDDELRLGRATDFQDRPDGSQVPLGQRLLQVDDDLVPLLEVRQLVITPVDEDQEG